MNRYRIFIIALVLVSALAFCAAAEACPGCAEAQAGQGAERSGIVRGYMLSIIFMMSMPFLIVTSFGTYVYLHVRRTRLAETQAQAESVARTATAEPQSVATTEVGVPAGA